MYHILKISLFSFLLILIHGGFANASQIACSMESKICKNGTTVSRIPPDCKFAPCPGEEAPKIEEHNVKYSKVPPKVTVEGVVEFIGKGKEKCHKFHNDDKDKICEYPVITINTNKKGKFNKVSVILPQNDEGKYKIGSKVKTNGIIAYDTDATKEIDKVIIRKIK